MNPSDYNITPQNHAAVWSFSCSNFTGNAPRKGKRIPLNEIKYNEQRVAARLGSGGLSYDATCVTDNGEVAKRSDELFWEGLKALNEHKTKPEDFKEMSLVDARGKEVDWLNKIDLDKLAMSWQLEAKIDPGKIHFIIDDNSYPAMPGNTRYENELIRELSSFGKDLIVLSPDNIRQKVFDHVVEQCKAYQGSK